MAFAPENVAVIVAPARRCGKLSGKARTLIQRTVIERSSLKPLNKRLRVALQFDALARWTKAPFIRPQPSGTDSDARLGSVALVGRIEYEVVQFKRRGAACDRFVESSHHSRV